MSSPVVAVSLPKGYAAAMSLPPLPDGSPAPHRLHAVGAGDSGAATTTRRTTRKFYRASAKDPREQARRVAWGREWGAIIRAETVKVLGKRR